EEDQQLWGVIDHVNLAQPWQGFEEAVLFYRSVLSLSQESATDVPGQRGLVRSLVMRTPDGGVRVPLNLAPPTAPIPAQHFAIRCNDIVTLARQARDRGLEFLEVPGNYYDDLAARFDLGEETLSELRELDLFYDRDEFGEFLHFYTPIIGGVFFEVVERRGAYDGFGAMNAGVRLAAQRHAKQ